jgi:hypothetical protein
MSVTVYGCIKWSESPPEIYFENLETCLSQSACIIWTGEHAGQVALTLSGADDEDCNDTFYSDCIEWGSSKKFKITIPEGCCCIEAIEFCSNCEGIWSKTPKYMYVTFGGIIKCPSRTLEPPNNHQFELVDGYNIFNDYIWNIDEIIGVMTWTVQISTVWDSEYFKLHLTAFSGGQDKYYYNNLSIPKCQSGFFQNESVLGDCNYYCWAYGGGAEIINPCKSFICESAALWELDVEYEPSDIVKINLNDTYCYRCVFSHTSDLTNKPGSGENWTIYWILVEAVW